MNRRAFAKFTAVSGVISLVGAQTVLAEATATPTDEPDSRLFGNAHDLIPTGTGEGVEIVTVGGFRIDMLSSGSANVVIRNNTDEAIFIDDMECVARDRQGKLMIVSERLTSLVTRMVDAGDIAIASIFFGTVEAFESDWEYEFEVSYSDSQNRRVDLEVTEVALNTGLDGFIKNTTDKDVEGPISILALFFNEDGSIQGHASTSILGFFDQLASGESASFKADYFGSLGEMTDRFLVGASGTIAQ